MFVKSELFRTKLNAHDFLEDHSSVIRIPWINKVCIIIIIIIITIIIIIIIINNLVLFHHAGYFIFPVIVFVHLGLLAILFAKVLVGAPIVPKQSFGLSVTLPYLCTDHIETATSPSPPPPPPRAKPGHLNF